MKEVRITEKYENTVSDERIEIEGKIKSSKYHAPLTRLSIRRWDDYKEVLFFYSSTEPAL